MHRKTEMKSNELLVDAPVAQIDDLPYRRLAVGSPPAGHNVCGLAIRDTADCQSALLGVSLARRGSIGGFCDSLP
jgi:hypothetical protein